VESDGIFCLSPLLRKLLAVACERRLSLISLDRFRQWDRDFLAIDFDSNVLVADRIVDVEILGLRYLRCGLIRRLG